MSLLQRSLGRLVDVRREETVTMLLMFAYSFLAMAGYNIVKPATRSQFINSLGADNLPYVQLVAGLIMGFVIQGYTNAMRLLPRRWVFAATQVVMVGLLVVFWVLFQTGQQWVSVVFYLWGVLAGSLLISQFWSLANVIFDARQAKRLFGFVGGGASLGGIVGSGFAGTYAQALGTNNLLLAAAVTLGACFVVVWMIAAREKSADHGEIAGGEDKGMSPLEAIRLLRSSKHFQVIALVISFAAIGAGIIEQQLNMAVEEAIPEKDARTALLANVIFYSSIAGFIIQMTLTSRLHRLLGIGFALLLMPFATGGTALLMLLIPALWTSTTARVLDTSLRYTVDKTTREILFVPLPTSMKYKAKPFADVAVDRFAKGVGAAVALIIAIKIFHLEWWQLSYLSLGVSILWIFMALRARREYLSTFRQSLVSRDVQASELRLNVADLSTIETLVEELAHHDPKRVVYAIDVLESIDKRNLVTPLLLYHEAPVVRRRALAALGAVRSDIAEQWVPQIRRLLSDSDAGVRAAAISALSAISHEDAASFARPLLADPDPRIRATAAVAMAGSTRPEDLDQAEAKLLDLTSNTEDSARAARRDVAVAIRQIADPRFRRLLVPLLYDPAPDVADEAMESVHAQSAKDDFIFVPTLVSLLRNRRLKGRARAALVAYGEPVVETLAFFLRDPEEDIWVRRHIPGTLGQIPSQKTVDVLVAALEERDGFIRYKVVSALERLRREHPELVVAGEAIEKLAAQEARRFFTFLSLHDNLFGKAKLPADSLLSQALLEHMTRLRNRIFKLLTLLYPPVDVDAARWTLEHGDARGRSSASEYLDNILSGPLRKQVLPVLEDMPREERVRRGNVLLKTRPRDVEETLLRLINDDDPVTAAAAIDVVRMQKMWSLADDVEHVLAHRDVKDWYVFEAASWTLAERRMPAERRRELWLEPLPAAELAGRLRRLPLFASVSVDELFRIAGASRQIRHEPGSVLAQEGSVPTIIHILIDGRVTVAGRERAASAVEAPAALGFVEAMAGLPMPQTYRTSGSAVTLALTVEELRTLLADNTDLVGGLFATLAERSEDAQKPVRATGAARELEQLAHGGLTSIERVFALQYVPIFRRVSADEIQHVATVTTPVTMAAGSVLFTESARPALWLLLSGEVTLESSPGQPPVTARAGDTIGSATTMAGQNLGRSARVVRDGIALKIDREDLFDVLGERPDLLRQMFAGLFRQDRPLTATR